MRCQKKSKKPIELLLKIFLWNKTFSFFSGNIPEVDQKWKPTYSNAYAKGQKWIQNGQFPGISFELSIILDDFGSSKIWVSQIRVSFVGFKNATNPRNWTYEFSKVHFFVYVLKSEIKVTNMWKNIRSLELRMLIVP